MRKKLSLLPVLALSLILVAYVICWIVDESSAGQTVEPKKKDLQTAKDPASLDARKKLLDEREAALTAREQQATALANDANSKLAEIDGMKKKLTINLEEHKRLQSERAKKTLKIYRSLRAEESAKLLDKLDEPTATAILNAMDQKTIMQMIPYLNQARVLKWTRETLAGMNEK